jgi:hypothetical protein
MAMTRWILKLILVLAFGAMASTQAASVNIEWQDADKYTDIRPAGETKHSFRQHVFTELEQHFTKLASQLPEQQQLKIVVTNIDLAGAVEFSGSRQIRIVRELYLPRISFHYQLLDEQNQLVQQEQLKLKDMAFMQNNNLRYRHASLSYEKQMLDTWFKKTFLSKA